MYMYIYMNNNKKYYSRMLILNNYGTYSRQWFSFLAFMFATLTY